ncbi:probable G-protein coupled receptor 34 [Callorhinchus milii]|uniref:probable G-protein coupled receptor 34 n=1 Tax=Callorhinchus milii TaxID=7868 RepID=UPI001C3FD53F|nr:probable G-protein coupled receptor 34 [Callorhinchus milii]XP_007899807.2 probable G-protein coupled receptor 34 [Callorhinchus milii]
MNYLQSANGSKSVNAFTMHGNATDGSNCTISEDFLIVLLPTAYSLIFLTGLTSNISALFIFLFIRGKKNSIQVYLINMAIADLLLIICLPFRIAYHANQNVWMLGKSFCGLVGNIFYMNMYISITLLGLISVDRYLKITRPLQHFKLQGVTGSSIICGVIWVISILVVIPMVVNKKKDNSLDNSKCFHFRYRKNFRTYINLIIVFGFWIVFFFLVLSYGKIARKLCKLGKERVGFSNNKIHRRAARKTFIVLFIFSVCFVPYHIFRFFYIAAQLQETSCYWKNTVNKINEISLLFSAFNSCLDPIMYFLLSKRVRRTVLSLISERFQRDMTRSEST